VNRTSVRGGSTASGLHALTRTVNNSTTNDCFIFAQGLKRGVA
jgi:hypothetical protein